MSVGLISGREGRVMVWPMRNWTQTIVTIINAHTIRFDAVFGRRVVETVGKTLRLVTVFNICSDTNSVFKPNVGKTCSQILHIDTFVGWSEEALIHFIKHTHTHNS